jgi:hypothetical protein
MPDAAYAMKRIAVLVIAATHHPLYRHYIYTHWTRLIEFVRSEKPHIDVFLLFEHDMNICGLEHLADNIIVDPNMDLGLLCNPKFHEAGIPGILSKTVHALQLLQSDYEVFFRTNLSSVIRASAFDRYVQDKDPVIYSGAIVWVDTLTDNLLQYHRIGPDGSVGSLSELDEYRGKTFVSGSAFFLNAREVKSLLEEKSRLRYDLPDDVAVGLMLPEHEVLTDFSVTITADKLVADSMEIIKDSRACHIRLENFPLHIALALWEEFRKLEIWK